MTFWDWDIWKLLFRSSILLFLFHCLQINENISYKNQTTDHIFWEILIQSKTNKFYETNVILFKFIPPDNFFSFPTLHPDWLLRRSLILNFSVLHYWISFAIVPDLKTHWKNVKSSDLYYIPFPIWYIQLEGLLWSIIYIYLTVKCTSRDSFRTSCIIYCILFIYYKCRLLSMSGFKHI